MNAFPGFVPAWATDYRPSSMQAQLLCGKEMGCAVSWGFSIPWVIASLVVMAAAVSDLRTFRIPNTLTLPALLAGLVYHGVGGGWADLQSSLAAVFFGGGLLLMLHALGVMGAGDVKLMAAIGAWLGLPFTYDLFVITALATGLCSVVMVIVQRRLGLATANTLRLLLWLLTFGRHHTAVERVEVVVKLEDRRRRLIPFAVMMTIGMMVVGGAVCLGYGQASCKDASDSASHSRAMSATRG